MSNKNLFISSAIVGALLALVISLHSNKIKPTSNQDLAKTSVMITNGHGGGTGVILNSGINGSQILTNNHVCEAMKAGGLLTTSTTQAAIVSFRMSKLHDVCLITTKANLHVATVVASEPPNSGDDSVVSGHPNLFPHIVTRGHFTNHVRVPVMTGVRPCTDDELNGDLAMVCVFLGGIPVVRVYDSQIVTSTIMAGSSGSGVFNSSGEISGLVFAGSEGLSYGFIVPQEYVKNFVDNEVKHLEDQYPNSELNIRDMLQEGRDKRQKVKQFINKCNTTTFTNKISEICNILDKSIIQ